MLLIGQVRGIRALCQVAESGSFAAAARVLGMTQSAVSQHVGALEGVVGLSLVQRGTRPLELTEAGAALVRYGAMVLTQLNGAEQTLGEISGRLAGRLRLGSFPTALVSFVGEALVTLREQQPGLQLTVVDEHMQGLVPRLETGELDLAVVFDHHPGLPGKVLGGLEHVTLFDDPYRALLPVGHRYAAAPGKLSLRALAGESWIGGRTGSTWFRIVQHACRTAGFEPRTILATDDYRAVQAFVAAGLGVAVVPGLAATHPLPGIVVREIQAAPTRRISVARLPGEPVLPQVRAMTEILLDTTARLRTRPAAGRR
ncbi:MAG: LysR family transcriptional regulator [Microlunatus sp.]